MDYALDEDGYYKLVFVVLPKIVINEDQAIVRYNPSYVPTKKALSLFNALQKYEGDAQNAQGRTPAGKPYVAERRTIQISDPGIRVYKFNGSTASVPENFETYPVIAKLREQLYQDTGVWTNFCLYNAYTPEAKLGWHSDNEKDVVADSVILSLSFGDVRRFRVRRIDDHKKVKDFYLKSGSLLTMEGKCQKVMQHSVWDLTKKELETDVVHGRRINLTFRVLKQNVEIKRISNPKIEPSFNGEIMWVYHPKEFEDISVDDVIEECNELWGDGLRRSCVFTSDIAKARKILMGYDGVEIYEWENSPISQQVKERVEEKLDVVFDYALLHCYADGMANIGYHNDKESLDHEIASVSVGQPRKFRIREIDQTKGWIDEYLLGDGDLLVMEKGMQRLYKHGIPKEPGVVNPRCNWTFRQFPKHW